MLIQKNFFTRISHSLNIYILTERRNCKTFWKKKYTIGLNSCYLFNVEHGIENEMDSAYGAFMH